MDLLFWIFYWFSPRELMTVSSCDIQNTGNVIGSDLNTQFGGHLTRKADPESISWRLIKFIGKKHVFVGCWWNNLKLKSWTAWWKNGKKVFINSVWFKHLWNERKTQSERKQQTCTELLFETHQKWKTETKTFTQTCFWLKQLRLLETAWLSGSYTVSISQICKVFR